MYQPNADAAVKGSQYRKALKDTEPTIVGSAAFGQGAFGTS
jgi:hypothetical protein